MPITRHTVATQARTLMWPTFVSMFCAGMSGAVVGFAVAVAVVLPAIHTDVATQAKQLGDRLSATLSAPMTLAEGCNAPAATTPTGHILGTSTSWTPVGPGQSSQPVPAGQTTTIIKKIIIGDTGPATTISGTGPQSTNAITSANTSVVSVSNANTVTAANAAIQSAQTGDATASDNTHSGSASSGNANNTVDTVFHVDIKN